MAQGATIHPPVSREPRRIENERSAGLRGMRRLIADVFSPLAMTLFTGNAQSVPPGVSHRTPLGLQWKRRAVTLQTARHDESSEVDLPIRVAGAVDPLPRSSQIGDRQFEQEPAVPVEIRLPSSPRPDDQIDAPGCGSTLGRVDAGLVENTGALVHLEGDAGRAGPEDVVPRGESPLDGPGRCFSGRREVGSLKECRDDPLVAWLARCRFGRKLIGARHQQGEQKPRHYLEVADLVWPQQLTRPASGAPGRESLW